MDIITATMIDEYRHGVLQQDDNSWNVIYDNKVVKNLKTFAGAEKHLDSLLLKGANRESTDNEGRTAAMVIGAGVPENTRNELETMLA